MNTIGDSVESTLIKALAQSSQGASALLADIHRTRPRFTKQALYVILRRLIKDEVVVKHGAQFSLSSVWIGKMAQFFAEVQGRYGIQRERVDFLNLEDGNKISYAFKNPLEADRFWGHAFDVLGARLAQLEPLYIYNPHEWFFFARAESEQALFTALQKRGQQVWLLCGGATELDREVKRYFDGTVLQYHMLTEVLFGARNYYLNIFGDYIIEAHIDPHVAAEVDTFYEATTSLTPEVPARLTALLAKGKTKLTISRNARKAAKLKKLFAPYFYVVKK